MLEEDKKRYEPAESWLGYGKVRGCSSDEPCLLSELNLRDGLTLEEIKNTPGVKWIDQDKDGATACCFRCERKIILKPAGER